MSAKTVSPAKPKAADNEIVITRVFNAPRALVYQAWTNPVHLARWWGPRGFTNPRCEMDVRPGGIIRINMRAPNGTVYPMAGIYLELIEPEQITFTSGALDEKGTQLFEFLHVVHFSEKNGKTTLTIRSRVVKTTPEAAKYIGGFEAGMTQSLEKLAEDLMHHGEPIVMKRTFDAPAEKVWRAISTTEGLALWFIELKEFKPEVGFKFQFAGKCDDHGGNKPQHCCQITEVVPGKKIAYTWRVDGLEGCSLVTMELTPEDGQTHLLLTHSGIGTFPKVDHLAIGKFQAGWTHLIDTKLVPYLAGTESVESGPLVLERTFNAPISLIWRAITNKDDFKEWYFELDEFKAEVGFEFQFVVDHAGNTYDHRCRVTEVIPGKKLAYTWRYHGHEGDSLVTFELFPEGNHQTRLKLTHTGLETFPPTPAFARANFNQGWTKLISTDLNEYVEKANH